MKKRAILFMSLFAAMSVSAQKTSLLAPSLEVAENPRPMVHTNVSNLGNGPEATYWSEDFSGGIPAGWTNTVLSAGGAVLPNGSWEYRGPGTVPNTTVGSRGAFAAGTGPIASATASNGFVIFDSDFLDNNGSPTNSGNGPAPTPHVALLTTDTIDLTGQAFVELKMHSHARKFQSSQSVAISIDGGLTFNDTVKFYQDVEVNGITPVNDILTENISAIAGNQALVVLRFIFDGRLGTAPSQGYYYWMIDDLEIRTLPKNEMRFTEATDGAPQQDILFNGSGPYPKLGHISLQQIVPISFDCNVRNYGEKTQTNVQMQVEIYNGTSLVTTLNNATPITSLASLDTVTYVDFVTPTWTPTIAGEYQIVYTFKSDSITSMMATRDTFNLFVTEESGTALDGTPERTSLDRNDIFNSIGTNNTSIGTDGGALGVMLPFENPDQGGSKIALYGVELGLSGTGVAGGDVQIEIYDTTGFVLTTGFAGSAIVSQQFTVNTGGTAAVERFDFTNGAGATGPVLLDPGTYYFVVYMFSNGGTNTIRIFNDRGFEQGFSSIFYSTTQSRWFTGFLDSRSISSPFIRAITDNYDGIGLNETSTNSLSVYPNPTNGNVNITLAEGGKYQVEVVDLVGHVVSTEEVTVNGNEKLTRDYSSLTSGIYLLNVTGENFTKTVKLTIK